MLVGRNCIPRKLLITFCIPLFLLFLIGCFGEQNITLAEIADGQETEQLASVSGQTISPKDHIIVTVNNGFREFDQWIGQLDEAVSLLPSSTLETIIDEIRSDDLYVRFKSSQNWHTGTYNRYYNRITINTTPDPDHPFPYEYLSENGYTDEEMLYVWLHEMGHAWHYNSSGYSNIFAKFDEDTPSQYGYYDPYNQTLGDRINKNEDFAESFALYVLLSGYMKEHFPLRYIWLQDNVFDCHEYVLNYQSSSAIASRLSIIFTSNE